MAKKKITIVAPCYNEENNIPELCRRIRETMAAFPHLDYRILFADNASTDGTVARIREEAARDPRVSAIVNMRNYGVDLSGGHLLMQADGDAVIGIVSDLQDPPELIADFIRHWEKGAKCVLGIKKRLIGGNPLMEFTRWAYYKFINMIGGKSIPNFNGFALNDRSLIEAMARVPGKVYGRGWIAEYGFDLVTVEYEQAIRKHGKSSYSLFAYFDLAMQGMTRQSRLPLRLASFVGLVLAFISLGVSGLYFVYKLLNWDGFSIGMAPLLFGMFFLGGVQLLFLGVMGEYIGVIFERLTQDSDPVIERERINYRPGPGAERS